MDGLLVDSEPLWRAVEIGVLDELGSNIRPILDRGLTMGMRVDQSLALFRSLAPWPGAEDEEVFAVTLERIVEGVAAAVRREAELLPGALDALDLFAAEGLALALASGSVPPVVEAVLERFSLRSRFAVVRSAVEVPFGKPHPALFLETALALGVEPSDCVVLEDSVNGCVAGKAAQMRVIAVPAAEDRGDARFGIADVVLDSLEQITSDEVSALLGLRLGSKV